MPHNNPRSIKELFRFLLRSPELKNFTVQYLRFKVMTLLNEYCRKRWRRDLIKDVLWKKDTLILKVSEPSLKRELSFHGEAMLREVRRAGFKFSKIKFV